jgi:bifunctional non-homologous end joining protein LigD
MRTKIKTVQRGKFPVVGFVKDPSGVAALYLGKKEGKNLVYLGKVGTGGAAPFRAKSARNSTPSLVQQAN